MNKKSFSLGEITGRPEIIPSIKCEYEEDGLKRMTTDDGFLVSSGFTPFDL